MFVQKWADKMGVKKPVELRIKFKDYCNDAEYSPRYDSNGNLKKHIITLYRWNNNSRDRKTLIVHELIHAYQEEKNLADKFHGKDFRRMAKRYSKKFPMLYIKGTDV
jgi:predicted SprT family Zn-dependent metalloprotease